MGIETLGDALRDGWRIRVRCAWGKRDAGKSRRECVAGADLDLETLVWTRGAQFPISSLETTLKCPLCGSRRVRLLFDLPSEPARLIGARR
jgi:hypothetical protein